MNQTNGMKLNNENANELIRAWNFEQQQTYLIRNVSMEGIRNVRYKCYKIVVEDIRDIGLERH